MRPGPLIAAVLLAACGHKAAKKAPPLPAQWDVTLPANECLFHAVAAAPVPDAWLVVAACGSQEESGKERLVATRIDERGTVGPEEDVHILTAGWATNVLVAPIASAGALVAWTTAAEGRASANVIPVDVQGRPAGHDVSIAPGRALAIAGGARDAAVAVITEPDTLTDDEDAPGATLTVYVVDPEGQIDGRIVLTSSAQPVRPFVSLAARRGGDGWLVAWPEKGAVIIAEIGPHAEPSRRGVASPAPGSVGLPPQARFWTPAIAAGAHDTARVVALVSGGSPVSGGDPAGEIWIGEGAIGDAPSRWTWHAAVKDVAARIGGLAIGDGAIAWSETRQDRDFAQVSLAWLSATATASKPDTVFPASVLFDGAVALVTRDGRTLLATSVPPAEKRDSQIAVALRTPR